MSGSAIRRGQRGQATLEHLGLTVAVALLLSAGALWLVREVRPPAHPPRFVQAAAQPLLSADSWAGHNIDPLAGLQPWHVPLGRGGPEPIGRALRTAGGLALGGLGAFGQGAVDRLLDHLDAILRNPLDTFAEALRAAVWAGTNPDRYVRRALVSMRAYVDELRRAGWRAAYLRLCHDAGGEAVDVALTRGQAAVRRLLLRTAARRLATLRRPGGPAGGGGSGP